MRSKPVTYLLLAATLFIWGLIVWKIVRRPEPEVVPAAQEAAPPKPRKDPRDTLWLEYRDPFLGHYERIVVAAEPEEPAVQLPPPPRAVHNIRYYGKIARNRVDNCLVEINGELHTMLKGATEDGYKLLRIYDDSLKFEKDGVVFPVPLSQ